MHEHTDTNKCKINVKEKNLKGGVKTRKAIGEMFKERTTKVTRLREEPESVKSLQQKDEDLTSNSSHPHKAKRMQLDKLLIFRLRIERRILGFDVQPV